MEAAMRHRHDDRHGDSRHTGPRAGRPPHYAAAPDNAALYDGLPSVTNRAWGADRHEDTETYGYRGQGGYGDFTTDHQGGYGESQGRHAQSGHGRGGADFDGHRHGSTPSLGVRDDARGDARATNHRGRGPRNYVRADDRIVDDIVDRLTDDPQIDASEILVMIENGEVTLSGDVPERARKHRAEDLAADARGVREVHNRIRVDNGARSAGKPGQAVRSGNDQLGSGFSSSARPDPVWSNMQEDSDWPGRNWPGQ
jgi:hypothetical protein